MKVSSSELKKELSMRKEELKDFLTLRLHGIFSEIIEEELSKEEDISLFDLIVRIIFRADQGSSENIASLMVLFKPERCDEIDDQVLPSAAAFIRDYLKKDFVCYILKSKKSGMPIDERECS